MKDSQIYEKLKAQNDEDILLHFPKSYDDMTLTDLSLPLANLQKAVLFGCPNKLVSLQGGKIIRFSITDEQGHMTPGMIYGQPFYAHVLKSKETYFFLGIYKEKQKCVMVHLVLSSSSPLSQNKLKPNYALPHDISQSSFYRLVLNILQNRNAYINEVLPSKYRAKYKLESRFEAFKDVHIPLDEKTVNRGLRVFKYEEALNYCLTTLHLKNSAAEIKKIHLAPIDKLQINAFIKRLPYKLTSDQVSCIREIVLDMDKPTCMNRLLQGDVGTGKTIVAFIAMYANALRGGQSALMAPTLALAQQHYQRALSIFASTPYKPVLIDNSLTAKQLESAFSGLQDGTYAFAIGTQSLFSQGVVYNKLSLVIIDEQHKFGVAQREAFIAKGEGPDVLMMSATPIPRTLSMIVNSDLDVSFLRQFPSQQRSVETKVVSASDPIIDKAIRRALTVHKQVFVIAPKIEKNDSSKKLSSKALYEIYCQQYGEDNVALLTGKIKKAEQEGVYKEFTSGSKPILVSTSLVEVGIDVPSAAVLIVYEANYFGLASLHQLRGRIGRNGEGALALFVYDGEDEEAIDKLSYLSSHSDGEEVALYDLQHRGGGDLYSNRQSGESELQVANFVTDYNVFKAAKNDAEDILKDTKEIECSSYVNLVLNKTLLN